MAEINPVELHLGSLISTANGEAFYVFEMFLKDGEYYIKGNDLEVKAQACLPIVLTVEWLQKLGFEFDEEESMWIDEFTNNTHYFCINVYEDEFYYEVNEFDMTRIIYVHQLQNLYLAIRQVPLMLSNEIEN